MIESLTIQVCVISIFFQIHTNKEEREREMKFSKDHQYNFKGNQYKGIGADFLRLINIHNFKEQEYKGIRTFRMHS